MGKALSGINWPILIKVDTNQKQNYTMKLQMIWLLFPKFKFET